MGVPSDHVIPADRQRGGTGGCERFLGASYEPDRPAVYGQEIHLQTFRFGIKEAEGILPPGTKGAMYYKMIYKETEPETGQTVMWP